MIGIPGQRRRDNIVGMRAARYLMIAFMALVVVMLYISATTPAEPAPVTGSAAGVGPNGQ